MKFITVDEIIVEMIFILFLKVESKFITVDDNYKIGNELNLSQILNLHIYTAVKSSKLIGVIFIHYIGYIKSITT